MDTKTKKKRDKNALLEIFNPLTVVPFEGVMAGLHAAGKSGKIACDCVFLSYFSYYQEEPIRILES